MGVEFTGFLKNSLVLIDTSSILLVSSCDTDTELFWDNLIANATASEAKIIVSSGVIRELDKHQSSGRKDEGVVESSKRALKKLLALQKDGAIFIVDDHINTKKDEGGVFADPYFINFVNTYKMSKNIYIITQDVNLMMDVHRTIKFDSLSGRIKDIDGNEMQVIRQKKVAVLKVLCKGRGDDLVIEAGTLRKFFPDRTLADVAKEIDRSVEECSAKLKELTGKDILATDKISKSYERRLKEAFDLIPPLDERRVSKAEQPHKDTPSSTPKAKDIADATESEPFESKLPEFKPIWE